MYQKVLLKKKRFAGIAATFAMLTLWLAGSASAAPDPILKCRQAIAAAGQKYEDARAKALQKCEEGKLKGKLAADIVCASLAVPPGNQKTADKISGAQTKLSAVVAKGCCGKDKTCGAGSGADADQPLSAIGWSGRVTACVDGERAGESCQTTADCPKACSAGQKLGVGCAADNQCPFACANAGTCISLVCSGGAFNGSACTTNSDCHGQCVGGPNNGLNCNAGSSTCGNATCVGTQTCDFSGGGATECPNLESGSCNNALANPGSIGACLQCAGDAGVDQLIHLFYASLNPPGTDKAIEKCKKAIGSKGTKYFSARRKILAGCEKNALKNNLPAGTCPALDPKAPGKIATAKTKLLDGIASACGGKDKLFGGTGVDADLIPSAVGAPLSCPNVTVPGGASCGNFINTVQDIANCIACLDEYKSTVLDFIAAPSNGAYPATQANPLCGNGKIDVGETCDDGNVVDGDGCPRTCVINPCVVNGTATATVQFAVPAGQDVSGLSIYLEYPDGQVSIPGTGSSAQVQARILNTPVDVTFTPNDLDYALRNVLTDSNQAAIPVGTIFQVQFNKCQVALPPLNAFSCRVDSAASPAPAVAPVFGVSCQVTAVS
jgi:cysteine-rich repeat protein